MEKNNNTKSNVKEYNNEERNSGIKKGRKNLTPIDYYNNNNCENILIKIMKIRLIQFNFFLK